jgi:hypothetical protein
MIASSVSSRKADLRRQPHEVTDIFRSHSGSPTASEKLLEDSVVGLPAVVFAIVDVARASSSGGLTCLPEISVVARRGATRLESLVSSMFHMFHGFAPVRYWQTGARC